VTGAARVPQVSLQPAQGMLHQGRRFAALRPGTGGSGWIGRIKQQHQGCRQLFCRPSLGLGFEGMPLTLSDAQLPMQCPRSLLALCGPLPQAGRVVRIGVGVHWTDVSTPRHPDAMQQRPRSPHTPIRWLHQLAGLMAQVTRAERLTTTDDSLQARRLRQRMALAQRLLDPLPASLQPRGWQEQSLWTALRWGGAGLLLALWLHR